MCKPVLPCSVWCQELRKAGVIDENGKTILDPAKALKTAEQGAATSAGCATSPQLDGMGGVYCENCEVARPVENVVNWSLGDSSRKVRDAPICPCGTSWPRIRLGFPLAAPIPPPAHRWRNRIGQGPSFHKETDPSRARHTQQLKFVALWAWSPAPRP